MGTAASVNDSWIFVATLYVNEISNVSLEPRFSIQFFSQPWKM